MKAFGSDRVLSREDGSLELLCAVPKGWNARRPGTLTSAEYPGTAVRWEERLFEVLQAGSAPDGSVSYRLAPWDDRHAIRVVSAYDAASEEERAREQRERHQSIGRRRLSMLLAPLAGHLPGPVQERMEWTFGASARVMTIASALPLFVLGVLGLLEARLASLGSEPMIPALSERPLLCAYLSIESALRLFVAVVQGSPMGSLAGLLGYELWRILTRGPTAPSLAASTRRERMGPWDPEDRYRMLEPLLGLLSSDEQKALFWRFGFDSERWTRRTARVLLLFGALNVFLSIGSFEARKANLSDLLWLVAGGLLTIEQVLRLAELRRGRAAGSVLGALVRPLARPLLDDAAAPE